MAFALTSSKYVPRKRKEDEEMQKVSAALEPMRVSRKDLAYETPAEVRQAPRADSAMGNKRTKELNANFYGASPAPMFRHHAATTPEPTSLQEPQGSPFRSGTRQVLPTSYDSASWRSVTRSEFNEPPKVEEVSTELQAARKKEMRSSALVVGDPTRPFDKSSQAKDALLSYPRENYVQHSSFPIGGPHKKNASAVAVQEVVTKPSTYQTLTMRQFAKPKPVSQSTATLNKQDMNRSHWGLAEPAQQTDYRTTAASPIPTLHPKVKGKDIGELSFAPESNPFACRTAAEARPKQLDNKEVASSKVRSCVPLSGGNALPAEVQKEVEASSSKRKDQGFDTGANCLPRTMTTTRSSFVPVQSKRREAINNAISTSEMAGGKTKIQSSISVGTDSVSYVPVTRSQFKGVYLQ